jgi:hypothetical protein
MQLSVYRITQELPRKFYSNINPFDYCDKSRDLIAQQPYTTANLGGSDKDTIIYSPYYDSYGTTRYDTLHYKRLRLRLPPELGQEIYDKSITDGISKDTFNDFLKGLYFTTTASSGNGSLILPSSAFLTLYYINRNTSDEGVITDTQSSQTFITTKEVLQLNHFEQDENSVEHLLTNNEIAYLKTPGGVFTEIDIPLGNINQKISEASTDATVAVNNVTLAIPTFANSPNVQFRLMRPTFLMLILKNDYEAFFDAFPNITSSIFLSSQGASSVAMYANTYISTYESAYGRYRFNNLTPLIKRLNESEQYKNQTSVKACLIPVSIEHDGSYTSPIGANITFIGHYLLPSLVQINKKDIRFSLIYSKF